MKRFTQTDKWKDPWFRELSPNAKLAFQYICDNADNAGVWDPDYRLANFCIKADIDWDEMLDSFGNRIQRMRNGKLWITRFIPFQYGELTPACAPHRNILELLKKHGIELSEVYRDRTEDIDPHRNGHEEPKELFQSKPNKTARDHVFEALADVNGADISRLTVAERGRLNKAAAEIRKVEPDVTPERVKAAAKAWKSKGYSAPATASVLASRWSELTSRPESKQDKEAKAQMKGDLRSARLKLDGFMDHSGTMPFPREDLTDDQIMEAKTLKELIKELERNLA